MRITLATVTMILATLTGGVSTGHAATSSLKLSSVTGGFTTFVASCSNATQANVDALNAAFSQSYTLSSLCSTTTLVSSGPGPIPADIEHMSALTWLTYRGDLTSLPVEITRLGALKHLQLNGTDYLSSLPAGFSNLTELDTFTVGSNRFTEFPSELLAMPTLERLDLCCGQIPEIPSGINQMTSLRSLALGFNRNIAVLPPELSDLSALQNLNMQMTAISSLPAEPAWKDSIRSLYLRGTRFTSFPAEVCNYPNLRTLEYSSTSDATSTLPHCLGNMTSLTDLTIEKDMAGTFPSQLLNLTNLSSLWLITETPFPTLPAGISNWTQLADIDVNVSVVPDELFSLPLQTFYITGATNFPAAISNLTDAGEGFYSGTFSTIPATLADMPSINIQIESPNLYNVPPEICTAVADGAEIYVYRSTDDEYTDVIAEVCP